MSKSPFYKTGISRSPFNKFDDLQSEQERDLMRLLPDGNELSPSPSSSRNFKDPISASIERIGDTKVKKDKTPSTENTDNEVETVNTNNKVEAGKYDFLKDNIAKLENESKESNSPMTPRSERQKGRNKRRELRREARTVKKQTRAKVTQAKQNKKTKKLKDRIQKNQINKEIRIDGKVDKINSSY